MSEEWTFDSVPPEDQFKFGDTVSPTTVAVIPAENRESLVLYSQGTEVGRFDFSGGVMKFSGKMDESAAAFLLAVKKLFEAIDPPDMV